MPEANWKRLRDDPVFRNRMDRRFRIISGMRQWFMGHGFLEVETPIMVSRPGMEPHLDPFRTSVMDHRGRETEAYLITSPEYAMKKLLAAGLPRIFEIARCFRNGEPWGRDHNPEFTMVEWYRSEADYESIMRDTEEMVAEIAEKVCGSARVTFRGRTIDLSPPWPRLTVADAFHAFAGVDLLTGIDDVEAFFVAARNVGIEVGPKEGFDDVFFKIFLRDIEPRLGLTRPVILTEYPRQMAALARLKDGDPRVAERFEVYCGGLELCNAFSELTDAPEQERRLLQESRQRAKMDKITFSPDREFLEAVAAMPRAAGVAFGVDRLVMLLTDAPSIRDVLFFPADDVFSEAVTQEKEEITN